MSKRVRESIVITTVGLIAACAAPALAADDYTWTGAADTFFSTSGNWNLDTPPGPAGPPVAGDTARFSTNATVDFSASAASQLLTLTNSSTVTLNLGANTYTLGVPVSHNLSSAIGSTLIIDGGSGSLQSGPSGDYNQYGHLTVQNGGTFFQSGGGRPYLRGGAVWTVTGTGSSLSLQGAGFTMPAGETSKLNVTNGGTASMPGNLQLAAFTVPTTVGGGSGTSTLNAGSISTTDFTDLAGHLVISSGGVVNTTGIVPSTTSSGVLVQATNYMAGSVTLSGGGTLNVGAGTDVTLVRKNALNQVADWQAILRGSGTLARNGVSGSFNIVSSGEIRPGDTSVTPAIGTINVTNGNLTQNANGNLFLNFDATTADLIDITAGTASVAGTVNLATIGFSIPNVEVAYTTWTFLIADQITYTATDNVAALMAAYPGNYTFGVADLGGQEALVLAIPEPAGMMAVMSVAALLALRRRSFPRG